ncbi:hypothetical protein PIB30_096700 [Stylosanthes scabra]|uniref:Homeobox-leucine zipper protein n=1 Tax=Stylosanthes scabra TaxID=79078 RepID=A0ABU6XVQ7_9FABA|nr:hypothetical protein [Stylosanthes scabra]
MNLMSHDGFPLFIGSKSLLLTTHKQSQLKWHKAYFNSLEGNESLPLNMGSMGKGQVWINEKLKQMVENKNFWIMDHAKEKKRLNMKQVKTLEKSFELRNKLGPEWKMQLARALSFQPRQIVIWFPKQKPYMVNQAIGKRL